MIMKDIDFTISEEIAESYPHLRIGVIKGLSLLNNEVNGELEQMVRKAESLIRENFTVETITAHPYIEAWRETYRSFGAKPKDYRPTCEALIRRVLKGQQLPTINRIVNCYLLAELEFLLPCGGYDIDKVDGALRIRYSKGNEEFIPIGAREIEFTKPGEVVYSDDSRILTRMWNYRDSDSTKITLDTQNVILMVEAPSRDISTKSLQCFLKRLSELLSEFCGGFAKSSVLNVTGKNEYTD